MWVSTSTDDFLSSTFALKSNQVDRKLGDSLRTLMIRSLRPGGIGLIVVISSLLAISTALTGVWMVEGPERAISLSYFYRPFEPLNQIPELSSLQPRGLWSGETWRFAIFSGDSFYYRNGTLEGLNEVISPYRYRVVPILMAQLLLHTTGLGVQAVWVALNLLSLAATAGIITYMGIRALGASPAIAILVPALMVAFPPILHSVAFISVDPMSVFFSALICLAFWKRSAILFVAAAVGGTLTKEILVVAGFAWAVSAILEFGKDASKMMLLKNLMIAATPAFAFAGIRLLSGAAALEVNYGFDLAAGEVPTKYIVARIGIYGLLVFLVSLLVSWMPFWLGTVAWLKTKWLTWYAFSLAVGLIVSVAFLASSAVRVMAPLGPPLALGVITFIQSRIGSSSGANKAVV